MVDLQSSVFDTLKLNIHEQQDEMKRVYIKQRIYIYKTVNSRMLLSREDKPLLDEVESWNLADL
jgi:hypothetical protein